MRRLPSRELPSQIEGIGARAKRAYANPIVPGFYPDPSICRKGDDFYLVTSSFEYFPGLPILHSRDLVHFRPIGHVLTRPSQLPLANCRSSGGLYAPTIRYHGGRFYVVCTNVSGGGNFLVSATRPEGPWSEPIWLDRDGFDPSLFFDGDAAYYTRDRSNPTDPSHPVICQARIDVETGKILGKPKPIFAGTGGVWVEASHLYRRGDWYYLVAAEGGTAYEHSVIVARSRNPKGPFESCPHNPVLTHATRKRDPFQALGHADLAETQNGETYAVLLGIRPKRGRYHHLGREVFLTPVTWGEDGWPRFGARGRVLATETAPELPRHAFSAPPVRDDFDARRLGFEYVFVRNPEPKSFSLTARPGYLRLFGLSGAMTDRLPKAFVGRRQTDFECQCRARLDFEPRAMADEAGLVVRSSEEFHYSLVVRRCSVSKPSAREAQLWAVIAGKKRLVGRVALERGPVILEIRATDRQYCFSAGTGRTLSPVGRLSTKALSAERVTAFDRTAMCFTGVVLGMYASGQEEPASAPADFDWFEYRSLKRA